MQNTRYDFTAGPRGALTFDYIVDVNLAMSYNKRPVLISCIIHNDSTDTWHDITLSIRGEAITDASVHIPSISPGTSIDVTKDIDIVPETEDMVRLSVSHNIKIDVKLTVGSDTALRISLPLRLMAYDQWPGAAQHPEMLAAYVMPAHPMLSTIMANATKLLVHWTGNGTMDEYQSGDANRVRQQTAAIFEAIRSEGIAYDAATTDLEAQGQTLRTVDKVLTDKRGTSLDLTLLMASCLEHAGIQPIIVLLKDHAMAGAWLTPNIGRMTGDDVSFLQKNAAEGINDIVLIDTCALAAAADKVTFDDAAAAAYDRLKAPDSLLCYINVAECRYNGIRPIAMRVYDGDRWVTVYDADSYDSIEGVKRIDRYDLSAYDTAGTVVTKYTIWERKLLDFSLHNNLLNMKLGKKIIPIISFNIDTLEDKLEEGKSFSIQPSPTDTVLPPTEGMYDSSRYPQLEAPITQQLSNGIIYTFHNEDTLKEALKYAYRSSRTSLEENGANNLYLVLGVLKWVETERRAKPLYAPLLLVPIEIIRGSRGTGYTIRTRDEETSLNITLTEMLKQQHSIDLSALTPLPTDQSGIDVKKTFAVIRDKIRDKRGWNVIEEAMIGLFSFSKFVMWNDIHTNSARLHKNPIISSLVDGKLNIADTTAMTDAKDADRSYRPHQLTIPIDVDSSQLEAIIDSAAGHSFILHGPPGTGKSQTITNMIANALYQGKRVLFVAEKMAALSVVQARLERIGLAPFCLELHSNKVTKQHFLKQMEMALDVTHKAPDYDYKAETEALYARRCDLMGYVEALHAKQQCGLSLYDCITGYLSIEGDEIRADVGTGITIDKVNDIRAMLTRLDTIFQITGKPSDSPLAGLDIKDGSADAERRLLAALTECDGLITQLKEPTLIALCLDNQRLQRLKASNDALISINTLQSDIETTYLKSDDHVMPLGIDVSPLLQEWATANAKWFIPRIFARRSVLKKYGLKAADVEYIIAKDSELKQKQKIADVNQHELDILFGKGHNPYKTQQTLDLCNKVYDVIKCIEPIADIDVTADTLADDIKRWTANAARMRDWYLWCKAKSELTAQGLGSVVDLILASGKTGREAAEAYTKGVYHALALNMINSDDKLRYFNGLIFNEVIDSYRKLTASFQELSKRELFCRLASKVPTLSMAAHDSSEVGILKRNIRNGGRGTSIRRLIDQIPTLLPKLCPCMLMSPLSVAQYIDLSNDNFDIVIFDEASQMPTSEAIGAIARGNSLIVVGDPQQMPPTSFFATSAVGEDEADLDDMESILDDCLAISIPSKHLTWHYRSKHESLIAFSNSQYYGGRLLTFPSVDDRQRKVSLRSIDGLYQRSGARVNLPEAQAVVNEVIRRLSDPEMSRLSIGIVSFSKVQQDKIEDLLTDELSKHPDLEAKAYESTEPIFIKNLENVQGDERDVILFSIGYGPDKDGKVSMNFGPLNNKGGERRLNVAVSRARYEMIVFSSLKSEHIDLRRTSSLGVEGLKKFLEFAEKGNTSVTADNQVADSSNCIAAMIADELRKNGYETSIGVGRSHFKVDVAVIDPKDEGKYMLGILLDGPAYYQTKTVRDREVVQPSVLKGLKWSVMRVWTLDWFERQDQVIKNILTKLDEIQHTADKPADPAPKPVPEPVNETVAEPAPEPQAADDKMPVSEYKMAQGLKAACAVSGVDDLASHRALLTRQIKTIVAAEQPITASLLYKRIVKIWGLTRTTPRLQAMIDELLSKSSLYSTPNYGRGSIWWTDAKAVDGFDGYRTGSDRDIQDTPILEIVNAMRYVIDQQIAMDRDDLKRLTANQLGYTRKGTNIDAATDLALSALINDGYVTVKNDKVSKA